jgi:hypothetical protein
MNAKMLRAVIVVSLLVGFFRIQAQVVGGYSATSLKDKEVVAAAKFAITEQSKSEKVKLVKLEKAERQVVAGMNYKLLLKVQSEGKARQAEVVVWRKLSKEYALTSWTWK